MESDKEKIINDKISQLELLIEECEELRVEWKQRLNEVKQLRDNYTSLVREYKLQGNDTR